MSLTLDFSAFYGVRMSLTLGSPDFYGVRMSLTLGSPAFYGVRMSLTLGSPDFYSVRMTITLGSPDFYSVGMTITLGHGEIYSVGKGIIDVGMVLHIDKIDITVVTTVLHLAKRVFIVVAPYPMPTRAFRPHVGTDPVSVRINANSGVPAA